MSGSNSYTEEEVAARTEALQAGVVVLDRNTTQSAVDLVSGIQDLIFRALNSDVDSVYALLKLLANRHIVISSKIISNIDLLERYASVSRQEHPIADSSKLTRLIEISEELEVASAGRKTVLLDEFSQVMNSFVGSSITPDGFHNAGISPAYAQERSLALAIEVDVLLATLFSEVGNFLAALTNYSTATLEPLSFENQARKATSALRVHEGNDDLSGAVLDSVIISSLLKQKSESKRDIEVPKYDGPVETLPGTAAEMLGGTKPFIIQTGGAQANFDMDGGSTIAEINGAESGAPSISINVPPVFRLSESGLFYYQTESNGDPTQTQRWFSSSDADIDWAHYSSGFHNHVNSAALDFWGEDIVEIPYLKSPVRPSSGWPNYDGKVSVNGTGFDSAGPVDVPVNSWDDGVTGDLISNTAVVIPAHMITPTPAYDGVETVFVYNTGTQGATRPVAHIHEGQLAGWGFGYYEGGFFVGPFGSPTTAPSPSPGFYKISSLDGIGDINYITGEVRIEFYNPPPIGAELEIGLSGSSEYTVRELHGKVVYETGHVFFEMEHPAAQNSYLTCSYEYHPMARLTRHLPQPGTPISIGAFNDLSLFSHNTLVSVTLPSIPLKDISGNTWGGPPAEWILSPTDLGTYISNSTIATDVDFSLSPTKFTFEAFFRGTASRIAFPHFSHDAVLNLSTPFTPTWGSTPENLNEAISAKYLTWGERFGLDTQFSSLDTNSTPINITCPENSLFVDVPITLITSPSFPEGTSNIYLDIPVESLEIGDDIFIKWDGSSTSLTRDNRNCHTKISSVSSGLDPETQSIVEVYPAPPFAIDEAVDAAITGIGDWSCTISRSKILARSQSVGADSAIEVSSISGGGLEYVVGAVSTGFSNTVALGSVSLSGVSTENGYEIHPNDIILERYTQGSKVDLRLIGRVTSVKDNKVTMEVTEEGLINYPYKELRIVSLGWYRFQEIKISLRNARSAVGEIINGDISLSSAASVFVGSGSGQPQYMSMIFSIKSAMDLIRASYLVYDAHTVKTVGKLLDTLKQEKLTLPLDMLMGARFDELSGLTVSEVSEQISIDNLLTQALDLLGGETDFVEYSNIPNPLKDYYERGIDDNYDGDFPDIPEGDELL
jgi:hypothetical protein